MATVQGKCEDCRVAFRWRYSARFPMRLKHAYCPLCGQKLQATTHQLQWPWRRLYPVGARQGYELQRRKKKEGK